MCFDTIEINQVYCAYILVCANLYKVMQVDSNGHNLGMMAVITRLGKNTFRVNKLFVSLCKKVDKVNNAYKGEFRKVYKVSHTYYK